MSFNICEICGTTDASAPVATEEQRIAREARSRKNARKTARKEPARAALEVIRQTLPAQAALVRVNIHAGNDTAAHAMAKALLEAYLWTGYASLTGAKYSDFPPDRMAARLRSADLIDSAALAAIMSALSTKPEAPTSAGLMLNAVEVLAFGAEAESMVARRARRKRILSAGNRLAQSCSIDPEADATGCDHDMTAIVVHESEVMQVLGVDWQTWDRDYRSKIPGMTTITGRFYLRSVVRQWLSDHLASSVKPAEVAGGAQ